MANGHGGARPGAGRKKKGESNKNYNCVEFTNKLLQELLASPHVAFVSRRTVTYTAEFKNLFWQRYVDGVDPAQYSMKLESILILSVEIVFKDWQNCYDNKIKGISL